jgi:hypothetical protein
VGNNPVSEALACTGGLNDTGITTDQCYQAGGALAACNSTVAIALNPAQDGMVGRDANATTNSGADGNLGFSYASVAGGCVQDNNTGLMWEAKTADGGLHDWFKDYTHYDSTTEAQKLDPAFGFPVNPTQTEIDAATNSIGFRNIVNSQALCGFSDWRLPTADELQSIVDYGVGSSGPSIDANWFPNTANSIYWSASPVVGFPYGAWSLGFSYGVVDRGMSRYDRAYIRLVRAGQPLTPARYIVSTDGQEVTDNQTHLIWRRCSEGQTWNSAIPVPNCIGTPGSYTHETALTRARDQASSTGHAWRLPNIKELASIADKSISNTAIDLAIFPATPAYYFWSATPNVRDTSRAWYVHFGDGFVYYDLRNPSLGYAVRLVRAGP